MIKKIISGGQTGADRGGLLAGWYLGLETGGTAPFKYITERGIDPTLETTFGLTEGMYDPKIYPKRTKKNVEDSDGTLLVGDVESPGTRLTIKFCIELSKPHIINPTPETLKKWIKVKNIEVLNVAGNRESKNPSIQQETFTLIVKTLKGEA